MFPAIRIGRTGATALLVLGLLAPAALADVGHVSVEAKGPGGRALIAPGDDVTLRETIANLSANPLTGLQGTLTSSTAGVTTDSTALPFTSTTFPGSLTIGSGDTGFDATPFRAHVPTTVPCGAPLSMKVSMSGASQDTVSFDVGTGIAGPTQAFPAPDGSTTITDDGDPAESRVDVPSHGSIKALRVRVDGLTHQGVGDLEISLVSPRGSVVRLMRKGQASGADLTSTVFAAAGPDIGASAAPHTGTFGADGDLEQFIGEDQFGTWTLRIRDLAAGHAEGVLDGWTLETSPPVCDARAEAMFSASPSPVAKGATASFDATDAQDPDDATKHFVWDFNDGTPTVDTGTTRTTTHAFATRGQKSITLTMKDTDGVTLSQASRNLLVDQPPVAVLTAPATIPSIDTPVSLDASASTHDPDPAASIVNYEFDLDGQGFKKIGAGTSPTPPPFTFVTSGPHTVRVRVIDDAGASDVASKQITVANLSPTAAFSAPSATQATGRPITLDAGGASGSADRDGTIAGYDWSTSADGVSFQPLAGGTTATLTPQAPGDVTVRLTVTDDKGATATVTHVVHVGDPPVISVVVPQGPFARNALVSIDVSGSNDPDGTITSWDWDLDGNGSFETPGQTSRTVSFPDFAPHVVGVRATDDDGVTTEASVPILVANRPPLAVLTADRTSVVTGSPVTVNAGGSSDPDGTIAEYRFDLDDDNSYEVSGSSPVATMSYPNAGHVDIHVEVVDSDGGTATAVVGVTVVAPSTGGGGTGGSSTGGAAGSTPDPGSALSPGTLGSAAGGTPAGTTGGGATATAPPAGALTAGLNGATVQKLKTVLKSGVALGCKVDRAATCAVSLTVRAADARRLRISSVPGAKPVVIGTATAKAAAAGTVKVTVKLKAAARKRLAKATKVVVMATGKAAAGAASVNLGRSLLLRR